MKLRFNISTLMLFAAIVAAYLAGRIPLLLRTQTAERRTVEAESKLEAYKLNSDITIWGGDVYSLNPILSNVEDAPFWLDKSAEPPLNAADTFKICSTIIEKLESESSRTNIEHWHLESLSMIPLNEIWPDNQDPQRWIYCARFLGLEPDSPEYAEFSAMIVMDGTVLIGNNDAKPGLYKVLRKLYPSF